MAVEPKTGDGWGDSPPAQLFFGLPSAQDSFKQLSDGKQSVPCGSAVFHAFCKLQFKGTVVSFKGVHKATKHGPVRFTNRCSSLVHGFAMNRTAFFQFVPILSCNSCLFATIYLSSMYPSISILILFCLNAKHMSTNDPTRFVAERRKQTYIITSKTFLIFLGLH